MTSEILIKGMVCQRCVSVIREGISNLGYEIAKITLGKVSLKSEVPADAYGRIALFLRNSGFELISSRQVWVVNQAKELINEAFAGNFRYDTKLKFSGLLSAKLRMDYDSISQLFSRAEGTTIEKYIIARRLEKVKELLVYTKFTLTEIAYITGFSSINHLSRQFKELTGLTPSHFKSIRSAKKKLSGDSATPQL